MQVWIAKLIRLFDFVFALMGLVFGFPVLVLLMLIGWLDTGSPIFRQERVGRHKKPFTLVKFRTMKLDTASVASHLASASAITPLGHFLRGTKLDELPQLWNVLVGDMSLVGPRPITPDTFGYYTPNGQSVISIVRPGITGVSSIIFRSEEDMVNIGADPREFYKQQISPYKEALELWFVDHYSLKLYFKLIMVTAVVLFSTNSKLIFSFVHGVPDVPLSLRKFLV